MSYHILYRRIHLFQHGDNITENYAGIAPGTVDIQVFIADGVSNSCITTLWGSTITQALFFAIWLPPFWMNQLID